MICPIFDDKTDKRKAPNEIGTAVGKFLLTGNHPSAILISYSATPRLREAPRKPQNQISFWKLPCPPITPRTVPRCVLFTFVNGHRGACHTHRPLKPSQKPPPLSAPLTTFRMNTCKSVSKQRTLSPFRMNTYAKTGEGGPHKLIELTRSAAPSLGPPGWRATPGCTPPRKPPRPTIPSPTPTSTDHAPPVHKAGS